MRVSFDLDEVLFVSPETHKAEPPLIFPLRILYMERLRLGAPALLRRLQELGYEVWIYTPHPSVRRSISAACFAATASDWTES
jgi:hypothetical protein